MPSADRKWRLSQGLGYGIIAIMALLPVALFVSALLIWGSLASALAQMDWSFLWIGLVGVGIGAMMVWSAEQGMVRERVRALALAGDARAMPPAAIKPPLAPPEDIARQPLTLLWRPMRLPWLFVITLLFTAIILTFALVALLTLFVSPAFSSLLLELAAALAALELGWFVWWWARRRRSSHGVVATDEGIHWLRPRKAGVFIPWDEARLFEVWRIGVSGREQFSGYALMSERGLVEWREYPPDHAPAAADGASYEEMLRRTRALVQTVIERTGLIPRTCEPSLAVKEEAGAAPSAGPGVRPSGWRRLSPLGIAFMLTLAAIPCVAAAGALLVPLTTSQPLNIYVAVTMGAAGLALVVVEVRAIVEIVREDPAADVPRPDVRLPPAPQPGAGLLSLRLRHLWRDRLIALVIGLLTAGDIYALVRGYIDFPEAVNRNIPWWDLHKVTITALFMSVFLLIAVPLAGIFHRGTRIIADERGLRSRRGRKETAIPWDQVAELVIMVKQGEVRSYEAVAGDAQRTKVDWPADTRWSGATPAPGESPAAVFAAAVAQRAGVTPRVEYT